MRRVILIALLSASSLAAQTNQGNWNRSSRYALNDVVSYKQGLYLSLAGSNTNNTPDSSPSFWSLSNGVVVYEVDGAAQTNRPTTITRQFVEGEIAACPRPSVAGTPVAAGSWQATIKNAWPDGSVRLADIVLLLSIPSSGNAVVTFSSVPVGSAAGGGACDNAGGMTRAQMLAMNSGNWDIKITVNPNSPSAGAASVTVSAKTMLSNSDPGSDAYNDCLNDYFLQGPVMTEILDQDCTSASASDFGWHWDGTHMASDGMNPSYTASSTYASLHPWFILDFFPTKNAVKAEAIIENMWSNRRQNQVVDLTFAGGTGPTTVYSKSGYTMIPARHHPKKVCSAADGSTTCLSQVRMDLNFAYMKLTFMWPTYDPNVKASTSTDDCCTLNGATSWATWVKGDKGDIGGNSGLYAVAQDYADNEEGAPMQREVLLYLYNMNTCGQTNGECAKAWQMLTGESGAIDTALTSGNVAGGAGTFAFEGNVPFRLREGRTSSDGVITSGNSFYCPSLADKNALLSASSCGAGVGNATGKALSRHAHSADQVGGNISGPYPVAEVGTMTAASWQIGACDHWQDWEYPAYLITGSPYFLEENYFSASYCIDSSNPDPAAPFGGFTFFGFVNHQGNIIRDLAWGLQEIAYAGKVAPDGTPEQLYYQSMVNSQLEIEEGLMGITNTNLTPSDTSCLAATCSFTSRTANRWNIGRAFMGSACAQSGTCTTIPIALHAVAQGYCDTTQTAYMDSQTDSYYQYWHYSALSIVLSQMRLMGYSNARPLSIETHKSLEEMVLDSTFNPRLIAAYITPVHDAVDGNSCYTGSGASYSRNRYIQSYARLKTSFASTIPTQSTFDGFSSSPYYSGNRNYNNITCGNHGYSLMARAAGTFLSFFGDDSSDSNCSSGTCKGSDAWAWLNANVPFFGNSVTGSTSCTNATYFPGYRDQQLKFALAPPKTPRAQ